MENFPCTHVLGASHGHLCVSWAAFLSQYLAHIEHCNHWHHFLLIYLSNVCLSASDLLTPNSLKHCPWIIVGIEAEWQHRRAGEPHHTNTSQRRTNRKRLDQLGDKSFNWDIPVVIATTCWVDNTRGVIQDDSNLGLFRAHYTTTNVQYTLRM